MKAIIHIGTEKTGTTSIQEFLYLNQETLKKFGYYFIQSAGRRNNRALPSVCMLEDKYDDFFQSKNIKNSQEKLTFKNDVLKKLKAEITSTPSHIHTVIISSEHFHSRTRSSDEIKNVYNILKPFFSELRIVCYLRRQVDVCTSLYSTAIKVGQTLSLLEFIKECHPGNIYYNYFDMLSQWASVFGKDSISAAVFNPKSFLNRCLLDDFTSLISDQLVGKLNKDFPIQNESLSYTGQVIGKAFNKLFPSNDKSHKRISIHCKNLLLNKCVGKGEQLPLQLEDDISNSFKESNEQLRLAYFPELNSIFEKKVPSPSQNVVSDNLPDLISEILSFIVTKENGIVLSDKYANLFRDAAIALEKDNLNQAYDLMRLAHTIRPTGEVIRKKLNVYQKKLNPGSLLL